MGAGTEVQAFAFEMFLLCAYAFCVHVQFLFFIHPTFDLSLLTPGYQSKVCAILDEKAGSQPSRLGLSVPPGIYFTCSSWQAALSFTIVSCVAFSYPEAKKCGYFLNVINFLQGRGPCTVYSHRSSGFRSLGWKLG